MGSNFVFFICVLNLFCLAWCKTFKPCELAHILLDNDIDKDDISTWLCIARYESNFNSSAVGHMSGDGSLDHGIFQINDKYWCTDADDDILACGITCKALENDDLSDDIACARRIFRQHKRYGGNGWTAWAVYPHYCTNKEKNTQRFLINNNCSLSSVHSKLQAFSAAPAVISPFTTSPSVINSNKIGSFSSTIHPSFKPLKLSTVTLPPLKRVTFSPITSTTGSYISSTRYPTNPTSIVSNRLQFIPISTVRRFNNLVTSTTAVNRQNQNSGLLPFSSVFHSG